jgi:hypothetical protein
MTRYVAVERVAKAGEPRTLDLGEHQDAASAAVELVSRHRQWLLQANSGAVVVCSANDAAALLALFARSKN